MATGERHAWELSWWWDLYFTGVIVLLTVLGLLTSDDGWSRWVGLALTCALIPLYWGVGRPIIRTDLYASPRSLAFVLVVAAICSTAIVLNANMGFLLLALAPLCYMAGGSGYGTLAIGLILLLPWPVRGVLVDEDLGAVLTTVLSNAVILAFAYWFGRWFERVVMQSWERSELIRQLEESREEASRLSEEAGAMAEREHLAREMHDTLAQGFTSIITLTQAVESEMESDPATARRHLALMRETATENLDETRAMVAARRSIRLENDSMDAALERITERLGTELGITARARVLGEPAELTNDVEVCVLRTAQEALANIRKHAGATSTEVTLSYTDVGVSLTVSDDGHGFDPKHPRAGNGLANMRHRAENAGGILEIDSSPQQGTTVRLTMLSDDPEEQTESAGSSIPGACIPEEYTP